MGLFCIGKGIVFFIVCGLDSKLDMFCMDGKWMNGYKVCVVIGGVIIICDVSGRL